MKKIIIYVTVLFAVLLLGACGTVVDQKIEVTFTGTQNHTIYEGDEAPNYTQDVFVYVNNTTDITYLLTYDDSDVDLLKAGSYEVILSVEYLEKIYETTLTITVNEREWIVNFIIPQQNIYIDSQVLDYDYYENVEVYINDLDVTQLLTVDDSNVMYQVKGSYDVIYQVVYDGKTFDSKITVHISVQKENHVLTTYYVNDLHGALLRQQNAIGIANMASVILADSNVENSLFIAGGDMLQGQVISNYFEGASTIDILNQMNLDAFVIGNHEFDWGLQTVLQYFNGENKDLQAKYPLLGANVIEKESGQIPNGIKPYVIVEKGGYKIAIIGVIGQIESSISYEYVKDYTFTNPLAAVKLYTKEVKGLGADMVVVAIHDQNESFNQAVSLLSDDEHVDLILNAHSHKGYTNMINDTLVMQSNANGTYVGKIVFELSYNQKPHLQSYQNLGIDTDGFENEHPQVYDLLYEYYLIIEPMLTRQLLISKQTYNERTLTEYIAKLMRLKYDADIAFHNTGGTRKAIAANEIITEGLLYQVLPYDNQMITMKMLGKDIKQMHTIYNNPYSIDPIEGYKISSLVDSKYYTVVVHSYIYGDGSIFYAATDINLRSEYIRDIFIDAMYQLSEIYEYFDINNPVVFEPVYYVKEKEILYYL